MRFGRRVAIDVGTVRVGIAASDVHSILASGLVTIKRGADIETVVAEIVLEISEIAPIEIYVGLPVSLSGNNTASTQDALAVARALQAKVDVDVRMLDERMTTMTAASALRSSNRDSKSGRAVIDQIAASVILEQALAFEKSQGISPGQLVSDFNG